MAVGTAWAGLAQDYDAAIADAKDARPGEIVRRLTAFASPEATDVFSPVTTQWKIIDGQWHVLVTTWAGNYLFQKNWPVNSTQTLEETTNLWVAPALQIRNFFKDSGFYPQSQEAMILRLEQLYGLPRNSGKKGFVEMWVRPVDLFRPSADPEVTDHEAELDFPWKTSRFMAASTAQVREYGQPAMTYEAWFGNRTATIYTQDADATWETRYPWTRLGYTYDWANDAYNHNHVGLDEFVLCGNSTIVVSGWVPTAQYEEYLSKPDGENGTIGTADRSAAIDWQSANQLSVDSLRQSNGLPSTVRQVLKTRSFRAQLDDVSGSGICGFSYAVTGLTAQRVENLRLFKLKDGGYLYFGYSPSSSASDGQWWLSGPDGAYLHPSAVLDQNVTYGLHFCVMDNGQYDIELAAGLIDDPQVLGVVAGDGSSGDSSGGGCVAGNGSDGMLLLFCALAGLVLWRNKLMLKMW